MAHEERYKSKVHNSISRELIRISNSLGALCEATFGSTDILKDINIITQQESRIENELYEELTQSNGFSIEFSNHHPRIIYWAYFAKDKHKPSKETVTGRICLILSLILIIRLKNLDHDRRVMRSLEYLALSAVYQGMAVGQLNAALTASSIHKISSLGGKAKHAKGNAARQFVEEDWRRHRDAYGNNKSAFARDYVRRVHNEFEVVITEKQMREVWLKDAPPASKPDGLPADRQ